jgi:hypothetical protein
MNEGNQIHNYILCVCEKFYDTILLRFRLRFHTAKSYGSYGYGSTGQKVTVPTVPVAQQCLEEDLAGHLQGALLGE